MKKIILGVCVITFLAGCLDKVQTVDYYMAHKDEVDRVLQKCYGMAPDESSKDDNCINANKAKQMIDARRNAAKADILSIKMALKLYKLDNMSYPTNQQGLQALVQRPTIAPIPRDYKPGGYLSELPKDPWGKDYQYKNPGSHDEIDVFTFDPDISNSHNAESIIGSW